MCWSLCPTSLVTNPRVVFFFSVLQLFEQEVLPITRWFLGRSHGATSVHFGEVFERDCTAKYFLITNMAGRTACNSGEGNGERMLVWCFLFVHWPVCFDPRDHRKEPNDVFKYPVDCPALEMVATILFVEGILAHHKNQHSVCSIAVSYPFSFLQSSFKGQ